MRVAMPKSSTLTPLSVSMMLSGVMSRWTTPRRWALASAPATATQMRTASRQGSGPSVNRAESGSPSSSSITTYGETVPSSLTVSP